MSQLARRLLIIVCVLSLGRTTSAQITIDVTPSFAPNGLLSPSWIGYLGNAIASLESNLGNIGDRNVSPTAYEIAGPSPINSREVTVTPFNSWRGFADDTVGWDGPSGQFSDELGNRIHFGLHAYSTTDKFSLSQIEWELDSNDPQDTFDRAGDLSGRDYDLGRVGIDYVNGVKGDMDDIRYDQNNPALGSTPVNEIVYVGFGDAYTPDPSLHQGATNQQTIDMLMDDLCLCDLNLLGEYAVRQNGEVIAQGESILRLTTDPPCGDFDEDGDVDTADRTTQNANWTGALVPGDPNADKTFNQGDCDGDGDVDSADQLGTILNWTGAMNAGNLEDGGDANLVYNPANGNVKLDATDTGSGVLISFVLGTAENNMEPGNFQAPFIDVGTNTDSTAFQIGQTDPLNQGQGPEIDLGNIFPAGIRSVEELANYLTLAEYASALGQGGTLDLIVIPEPSSLALALIGMLGLLSRRRRK